MAIFSEFLEQSVLFMDNAYRANLEVVLKRCEEMNFGHKILIASLEVYKAKIEATKKLPVPSNVKTLRSFLGHVVFYLRFVRGFSQIARP